MDDINELIESLSPELQEFVHQKLDSLTDEFLICLAHTFMPYPALRRKPSHPDSDDWFVVPEYLGDSVPHSKNPIGEGLRMITWQLIVFAEAAARNLCDVEFWSRKQIDEERRDYMELALRGEPLKNAKDIYYDPDEDDNGLMDHFSDEDLSEDQYNPEDLPQEISMTNEQIEEALNG